MERILAVKPSPTTADMNTANAKASTLSRRRMLGLLGPAGMALIVGFDPVGRRWVTRADTVDCPTFADIPPLDGQLLLDDASRAGVSTDKGNLVQQTPCAVLRPEIGRAHV